MTLYLGCKEKDLLAACFHHATWVWPTSLWSSRSGGGNVHVDDCIAGIRKANLQGILCPCSCLGWIMSVEEKVRKGDCSSKWLLPRDPRLWLTEQVKNPGPPNFPLTRVAPRWWVALEGLGLYRAILVNSWHPGSQRSGSTQSGIFPSSLLMKIATLRSSPRCTMLFIYI